MTAVLRRRPDIGKHLVDQMGLRRPIVDLVYISFFGSVAGHVAGGGFSNKPIENLATLMLVFGLYIPRLIFLAPSIKLLLKKPPPFQFYFVMQALLLPMRLFLGFWNGEPHIYVITDMLLAVAAILIYVVSRSVYEHLLPITDKDLFHGLVLAVFLMLFVGEMPVKLATAGVPVLCMGAVLVILLAASHRPLWQAALGLVILAFALLSVPRGLLVAIGVVTVLVALSNIFWRTILIGIAGFVTALTIVILNYQTIPNLPARVVQLGEIVDAARVIDWNKISMKDVTSLATVSVSIHERVWEAEQVVTALDQKGLFSWAFGLGYGTALNFADAPDPAVQHAARGAGLTGGGLVHNVHLIIFEQLLRFGLLGLAVFLWMGWRLFRIYWRCREVVMRKRQITFDFMCILTVLASFTYFQFASDWDIAFVAFGILGYLDARFEKIYQNQQSAGRVEMFPPLSGEAVAQPI